MDKMHTRAIPNEKYPTENKTTEIGKCERKRAKVEKTTFNNEN